MDSAGFFAHQLAGMPVMGIFRDYNPAKTVAACERAWQYGVDIVEVPVQNEDALDSLRAAVFAAKARGRVVGAGTVLTAAQVEAVREIGADFTVSPGFHPEVVAASREAGLPHLPGVATATEIAAAMAAGLTWLKAFPAKQLGPEWITAQHGPFPQANFVATGGIDADNAADFLLAGARAVAVGSALSDPDMLSKLRLATTAW